MTPQKITTIAREDLPRLLDLLTNVSNVEAASEDAWDIWWEVFEDTSYDTAVAAIKRFASRSTKFPSPGAIREYVDELHGDRLSNLDHPGFPPDLTSFRTEAEFDAAYTRWMKTWRKQIKLGATVEQADEVALAEVGLAIDRAIERPVLMPNVDPGQRGTIRILAAGGSEQ